jgi:hypothetical protein
MLATMWIVFTVVYIVVFIVVVSLIIVGMIRATKRAQNNHAQAPIPDSTHRNPNTRIDSENVT